MSAGRLGNEMFVYAATLGIAAMNDMIPVYLGERVRLAFAGISADAQSPKQYDPTTVSLSEYSALMYDAKFETLRANSSGDVVCTGFFQSWKYFRNIREKVVKEFTFLPGIRAVAEQFLREAAAMARSVKLGGKCYKIASLGPRTIRSFNLAMRISSLTLCYIHVLSFARRRHYAW